MSENSLANILILTVQVPFTRGGAEILVEGLQNELRARGHQTDIVSLPFSALPKVNIIRNMTLWRALELNSFAGRNVDLVICTKFPTYLLNHPNKVLWLIHQHRQVYELYGTRFGDFEADEEDEAIRRMIIQADRCSLKECIRRYTISSNVSRRLSRYLNVSSDVLHPPLPLGNRYHSDEASNYILSVGRLCSIKRVDLIIRAMSQVNSSLNLKIVGLGDEPSIETYLRSEVDKHHLWHRVNFLGRLDTDELLDLYARAFAVFYAPYDEDYGYVTLEALASGKPVITAKDSGTVLEFAHHEVNSLVAEPSVDSIASACNRLYSDKELYRALCSGAKNSVISSTWDEIIKKLLGTKYER